MRIINFIENNTNYKVKKGLNRFKEAIFLGY